MRAGREAGRLVDLVTTRHLVGLLGCSLRTLRRWIAAGDLPRPFKIGGIAYWRRSVIRTWIERKEKG